jgi:hypothetical protein
LNFVEANSEWSISTKNDKLQHFAFFLQHLKLKAFDQILEIDQLFITLKNIELFKKHFDIVKDRLKKEKTIETKNATEKKRAIENIKQNEKKRIKRGEDQGKNALSFILETKKVEKSNISNKKRKCEYIPSPIMKESLNIQKIN